MEYSLIIAINTRKACSNHTYSTEDLISVIAAGTPNRKTLEFVQTLMCLASPLVWSVCVAASRPSNN